MCVFAEKAVLEWGVGVLPVEGWDGKWTTIPLRFGRLTFHYKQGAVFKNKTCT